MNTQPATTSQYLTHCMLVSLRRRALWLLIAALVGVVLGTVTSGTVVASVAFAAVSAGLTAAWIAASSWRRHSSDWAVGVRQTV